MDIEFSSIIENNQKETKRNLKNFKKKYPSLETFIEDSNIIDDKKIVNEKDIVQSAIDEKSRIEKKFWNQIDREFENEEDKLFSDSEECYKLLNSSLHIYVKHRESVLKRLHMLIQKFDEDGNDKSELESLYELFIKRGTTLSDSSNIIIYIIFGFLMTSSQHSQTISKLKAPSQGNLCQMFTFGLMTQKKQNKF